MKQVLIAVVGVTVLSYAALPIVKAADTTSQVPPSEVREAPGKPEPEKQPPAAAGEPARPDSKPAPEPERHGDPCLINPGLPACK